jgi:26S proteasome regulatory subunit N10
MTHPAVDAKAVAILLDNTTTSIDGDFFPTRLDAQKLTVERYSQYLFSVNGASQVALCTLSSSQYGVRASFTSLQARVLESLALVTPSTGVLRLSTGIKWAVLALRHCAAEVALKRVLAFVGGPHDIASSDVAAEIADLLAAESVFLDVVVIGSDVAQRDVLRRLIPSKSAHACTFLEIVTSTTILSDNVLASAIGPGPQMAKMQIPELAKTDPDLAQALSLSIAQPRTEIDAKAFSIPDLLQPPQPKQPRQGVRLTRVRNIKKVVRDEKDREDEDEKKQKKDDGKK